MAVTASTKVNTGNGSGKVVVLTGGGSEDDNEVILTFDALGFDEFYFGSAAGAFDVEVSLDGTNWQATALYFESLISATPATRVVVTAAGGTYVLRGRFAKIRFLQNDATDVTGFRLVAVQR